MKCTVVSFRVSMGLVWLWAACLLMFRIVFLFCWRISVMCLALEFAGSWVELDFFSLECNEVSSNEFWGIYGFGTALGSLSFNVQGCVAAMLEN